LGNLVKEASKVGLISLPHLFDDLGMLRIQDRLFGEVERLHLCPLIGRIRSHRASKLEKRTNSAGSVSPLLLQIRTAARILLILSSVGTAWAARCPRTILYAAGRSAGIVARSMASAIVSAVSRYETAHAWPFAGGLRSVVRKIIPDGPSSVSLSARRTAG